MCSNLLICFFFKQKTAYEMRISDWSSDVCSSDLLKLRDALGADRMDRAPQFLDTIAEPEKLILGDAVMLRVARLHISFLELLEASAICPRLARPGVDQDRKSTRLNSSH